MKHTHTHTQNETKKQNNTQKKKNKNLQNTVPQALTLAAFKINNSAMFSYFPKIAISNGVRPNLFLKIVCVCACV